MRCSSAAVRALLHFYCLRTLSTSLTHPHRINSPAVTSTANVSLSPQATAFMCPGRSPIAINTPLSPGVTPAHDGAGGAAAADLRGSGTARRGGFPTSGCGVVHHHHIDEGRVGPLRE